MRAREVVVLMDGVIRFVDIGTEVAVWPRKIHIGQVCPLGFRLLMRLPAGCSTTAKYNGWLLHVIILRGDHLCASGLTISEMGKINDLIVADILRSSPMVYSLY